MDSGPGPKGPSRNDQLLRLSPCQPAARNDLSRVTNDLVRRVYQHKAKVLPGFTSRYGADRLVWFEIYADPATAISREKELKKWRRDWKIRLIEEQNPEWRDLCETIVK